MEKGWGWGGGRERQTGIRVGITPYTQPETLYGLGGFHHVDS